MSPEATTISGSTCYHVNIVAMATEKYFYNLKECELHDWQTYSFLGSYINGLLVNIEML